MIAWGRVRAQPESDFIGTVLLQPLLDADQNFDADQNGKKIKDIDLKKAAAVALAKFNGTVSPRKFQNLEA